MLKNTTAVKWLWSKLFWVEFYINPFLLNVLFWPPLLKTSENLTFLTPNVFVLRQTCAYQEVRNVTFSVFRGIKMENWEGLSKFTKDASRSFRCYLYSKASLDEPSIQLTRDYSQRKACLAATLATFKSYWFKQIKKFYGFEFSGV